MCLPARRTPQLHRRAEPEGARAKMADLESVLADVSYLMAMERSKAPNAKTIKKFALPDLRCVYVSIVCMYM